MLLQQNELPDRLNITRNGNPVADVSRSEVQFPLPGLPIVDEKKLDLVVDRVAKKTYQPPANAKLDEWGRIVAEQMGFELDRRAFADKFYGTFGQGANSKLEAPMKPVFPKVDSELLATVREQMIGQYTTYFNENNKNRSKNIRLAAKAINNQFVFPGETFSFNQVVGVRSASRGYTRAKIIVRGEVAEGIGGGICQISSTLFNAADRAGLKIVQRYSHSRHVPYVPPGRDATVSWYGPDFSFQNPYSQPVLIRALVSGGQTTILLYTADTIIPKTREVPQASKQLPIEIAADRNVNGIGMW
jgi:vancomycin resistance protein YoaR